MIKCEVFYDSESLKKDLRLKRIIELELSMDECSKMIGISKQLYQGLKMEVCPIY